jgi:phage terminase Nu1 subunit (DNA packaging protein)
MTTSATCNPQNTGPLWTTRDLARFIGCSERQVARLREEGLPVVRVGGLIRFVPSRVMAWLDGREAGNASADDRASQLADIAADNDGDAAECAAADMAREFPHPFP